jgi:hypothetical protein
MEGEDLIKIILGGSVGGLSVQGIVWLKERNVRKSEKIDKARVVALQIAVTLESFAQDCATMITENEVYEDTRGTVGNHSGSVPNLPEYPSELEWNTLDHQLASDVFGLRGIKKHCDGIVNFWADADPEPDRIRREASNQSGRCGLQAWNLAVRLRAQYSLPATSPNVGRWNFVETLRERHEAAERDDEID